MTAVWSNGIEERPWPDGCGSCARPLFLPFVIWKAGDHTKDEDGYVLTLAFHTDCANAAGEMFINDAQKIRAG